MQSRRTDEVTACNIQKVLIFKSKFYHLKFYDSMNSSVPVSLYKQRMREAQLMDNCLSLADQELVGGEVEEAIKSLEDDRDRDGEKDDADLEFFHVSSSVEV